MHTRKIRSNRFPSIVTIIEHFGIVLLWLWSSKIAVCAEVPKGDHGAAEMDYQMKQFSRLQPSVDVSEAPPDLDPVIWKAFIPPTHILHGLRATSRIATEMR